MAECLNIISYNCKGFKIRNYDYLQYIFTKCDILLIQESWLFNFEINKVLDILPNSSCIGVSAMNDCDVGRQGRPHGGCLIIYKRNIAFTVNQITTTSSRLCAATFVNDSCKLLILSVYMPIDDNSNSSALEYGYILNEIYGLLEIYNDFTLIIGGDFNTDFQRQTFNLDLLNNFITVESLICTSLIYDIDFTFESVTGARSTIDHFIFNENSFNDLIDFKVLDEGFNLSDHCPIYVSIKCDNQYLDKTECNNKDNLVFNWFDATDDHLKNYKSILDCLLDDLLIPDSVINCTDRFCSEHRDQILDYLYGVINIMMYASRLAIANNLNKKCPSNKVNKLPGWNMYVKQYKDDSIKRHIEWRDAGRPEHGLLSDMRRQSRAQYHKAVKFIKHNKDRIVKFSIANSLKYKNYSQFWKEIRKLKGCNRNYGSVVVDNILGDSNIANLFRNKYDNLYYEFNTEVDMSKIDLDIRNLYAVNKA